MEAYEEFEYKDHMVKIMYDENPENPRTEWDNLAQMICFHGRYNLGDKHNFTVEEAKKLFDRKDVFSLPIYLYDHSGITINTTGFSCPWDSGMIGGIVITKEQVRKEYGVKKISPKLKKRVYDYMRAEVETYDQFLTGEVYGYTIETKELQCGCGSTIFDDTNDGCVKCVRCGYIVSEDAFENEEVDSCWGFFGNPKEYMIPEIKSLIDGRCRV